MLESIKCSDTDLFIAATRPNHQAKLWAAINRPDIPADPRFADPDAIRNNADALYRELGRTLSAKTAAQWERILNDAGVPAMRVNTVPEVLEDPQIKSRGLFHTFDSIPGVDAKITVPLTPYKVSEGGDALKWNPV